ncbi:MAG: tRNA (cytidine(34)-2'-O)-methyltransferase [Acidobacteriota bacterium]
MAGTEVSLHVALVEPEIPWNTGNAGRSCLASGAKLHLIKPLGFSLDDKEVKRAGLDYWPRVKPTVWSDWRTFESRLGELGEPYFISPEAPRSLWEVLFPARTVLLFGSESRGFPTELRKAYRHRLLSIPNCDPSLRSLNLSTSVGIGLYEVIRQRHGGRNG